MKIFPQFEQHNFIFLNKRSRIVFMCDPHYSDGFPMVSDEDVKVVYESIMETVPMVGTYSVLLMACIYAWLQIYVLGNGIEGFNNILSTIPASKECICRWTEQQYAYPTSKECSELIKFKIGLGQNLVAEKYISVWDFLEISQAYLERDLNAYVNFTGKNPSIKQGL